MARLVAALLCLALAHHAAAQVDGVWTYFGSTQCSPSSSTASYTLVIDTRGGGKRASQRVRAPSDAQ